MTDRMLDHVLFRLSLRRRVIARYVVLLSVLVFVLIPAVLSFSPHNYERLEPTWTVVSFVALGIFVLAGLYLHNGKCARCGNRYAVHARDRRYNSFTLECLNCGLSARDIGEV
jgi:hypothetical protein